MMTQAQAERLVRKIDELLGKPGLEAQAAKLAQDYAELGRAANRRLEQCAAMIDNGEDLQALQLAETQPPLLDLITLLSFRQAKEWRDYCQTHNLPCADSFYDKHVRLLNATYGKGVASDQSFYRDYRRAVMQGDEPRARSILRVIARLNPGDKNTAQELRRLEEKAVQAAMEELRQVLATNDAPAAIAKLTELEGSALAIPANHPVWLQAQVLRCRRLLRQAEALREREAWEEAAPVVEEIRLLANQNDVPLSAADTQTWNELETWTSSRRAAVVQEQDFQHALGALQYQLETMENQPPSADRFTVPQLRADLDALTGKLQDLERFGRPLDAGLARRHQLACANLRNRIQRKQKRRFVLAVFSTAALLTLLAAIAAFYFVWLQARDTAARLQAFEAARRVKDTERALSGAEIFVKRIPAFLPSVLDPASGLKGALGKARQFVTHENELKQDFDRQLAALQILAARGFSNSLDQVAGLRAVCAQALARVAPEFQAGGQIQLAAFDKLWEKHLAALQPAYDEYFEKRLTKAESFAAGHLNLTNGFDALTAAFPQVQSLLTDLDTQQHGTIPLAPGLIGRFHDLTNQCSLWQVATERLLAAQSLADYLSCLRQFSESSLLPPAQQALITKALALKSSPAELLGALLLPDHPEAWASLALSAAAPPTFRPDRPNDAEKEAYFKLRDDKNIQEIYLYKLDKRLRPDNPLESHYVLTRGKLGHDKFGAPSGVVYDPYLYPDHSQFVTTTYSDWDYTNIEYDGIIKESRAFQDLQLGELIDSNTGNYQMSILGLLDQLAQNRESRPLFRAYVSLRLFEIAELRPADWGLLWCPGAALRIQSLKDLGAGNIRSGDWLVQQRYDRLEQALRQYFDQAATNSLEKQARFFQLLAHQACEAGFAFAGFADANGKPVITQANTAGLESWGWGLRSFAPVLLLRRTDTAQPWQKLESPLPFSPLFIFREDRRDVLKRAADATLYSPQLVGSNLPPLFTGL